MKKLLLLIVALFLANIVIAQDSEVIRLSEPVQETETYEVFGAEVEEWNEALSLSEVVKSIERFSKTLGSDKDELSFSVEPITIEAEVAEVCMKKGCFFIAKNGDATARITFKDYDFFVPTDSQGKKVKFVGRFEVKELTEDQAKHYAEDAGEDPEKVSGPQKEYSIVATSVLVPRKL